MRGMALLTLLAVACSSELEPGLPRVAVRQAAAAPGRAPTAEVRGDRLVVGGHYSLRHGCRALSGRLEQKPGVLRLLIVGTRSAQPCAEGWSDYDYEAVTAPVPSGSYQLTVVHVAAEAARRPLPIVLRRDIQID
jgi:hypothetical protein